MTFDSPISVATGCVEAGVDFSFRTAVGGAARPVNLLQIARSASGVWIGKFRLRISDRIQIWSSRLNPGKLPVKLVGPDHELWAWIGQYDGFLGYMAWVIQSLKAGETGFEPL